MWLKIFSQWPLVMMILLSSGFTGFYWLFQYDNGSSIQKEIDNIKATNTKTQSEVKELELRLVTLQETDNAINEMGDEFNQFLALIPDKMNSSVILDYLTSISKITGVHLQTVQNTKVLEKKDFYEKFKVDIIIKGFYGQILMFLSKLTGLPEIVTVESFTMDHTSGRGQGSSTGEVEMKMDVFGYRYVHATAEKPNTP